jgi:hypothetical protein
VWADGVYLQARMEEAAECMLVLIGATPEGKKELIEPGHDLNPILPTASAESFIPNS